MKKGLEKYINEIFQTLKISSSFEVVDCKIDTLPVWAKHISITHEFLIWSENNPERQRLQTFTGKNIFEFENNIYWFDGDPIKVKDESRVADTDIIIQKTNFLKTDTRLHALVDDYIYNHLGAEYFPDFKRFENNLELSKEENLKYLGTYFPRSYAESFSIFENIFLNKAYHNAITSKETLNILSIGSGTGGDLIGLITVIEKYCPDISEIYVWAFDGNAEALRILELIIKKIKVQSSKVIKLKTVNTVFDSIEKIDAQQIENQVFDFILSFKLICEIISKGTGRLDNSYYEFVKKFVPMLSDTGLCVLLDVTTKPDHTTYNPILMNRQVNQALRELHEYKTVLPVCCSLYGNECYYDCFSQQTFSITHSKYKKDKSKVAYRIIGHESLVNLIGSTDNMSKFLINNEKACPFTENNQILEDAFLLKGKVPQDVERHFVRSVATQSKSIPDEENAILLNNDASVFKPITPKIGVKVIGQIDLSQFEKPKKEIKLGKKNIYIIDTNVFVEFPEIISKINSSYEIILSAKVVDELDNLKSTLQDSAKKNVQKALKIINNSLEKRNIKMDVADLKLLPADFNKKSSDNYILSVALKYKHENPILLTSDNGLQIKAKGLFITTLTLKEFLTQIK